MRAIINRFDSNDELILLVDKVREKLHMTATSITKTALWEYCKKILEEESGKRKSKTGN